MSELLGGRESDRSKDATRKREIRSESARIVIPDCKNPIRREKCLADPELFLKTYFADKYTRPFGPHHLKMIDAILSRAQHGGRQAIAAPRGCGKSELVKGMLAYLVFAGLVRFPLPIAATGNLASSLFKDFQSKVQACVTLQQDFPEVCYPVQALEGAPQRAGRQHVDGVLTRIKWTTEEISLPYVPGSIYGGVKMAYYGLDAAFRGINRDGMRPDFVVVDDPETEESARSLDQIQKREDTLDRAIAGLAQEGSNLAIVLLTTIQNRHCLSYRVTDRKIRPSFNGFRFGMVVKWPTHMDLWENYIAIRHSDQEHGDEHGMNAVKYYLESRDEMDAGHEMLSSHYDKIELEDGTQVIHSALQFAFNKIADTSMAAYRSEYQNDPEPEDEIERTALTAARVQSRVGKFSQREAPSTTEARTIGIDIGNHNSHWVDCAWEGNAIGSVVDYGIMETHGLTGNADDTAVERAILASLEVWADEVVSKVNPLLCLIDSGSGAGHTAAVYEFCRRRGRPFFPSKGWSDARFRLPQAQDGKYPFEQAYAHYLIDSGVHLYNVNTEYWKKWLQQRFITSPFDEGGNRNDGSLVLFDTAGDRKRHLSFAHHMTAEEEQLVPVYGKESKRVWFVKNRNNHWLDAIALACAGAGCVGIRLIDREQPQIVATAAKPAPQRSVFTNQHGQPYLVTQR
jgi:hypothetical protein